MTADILIVEKIGATEVLIAGKEIAAKVAKGMISPNVLDYLPSPFVRETYAF
ncbi:MAG: hypothetical protein WCX84_01825 [Syntrophales bacterium]|nr:hypothetical protein [Syntrophales bacterium]NLN59641.1 hypothetical protein [Deltaproteobacteria bacterium]